VPRARGSEKPAAGVPVTPSSGDSQYRPLSHSWPREVYKATDKKDEAAKWRKKQEALRTAAKKPEIKP
jgi:hypothetical protein